MEGTNAGEVVAAAAVTVPAGSTEMQKAVRVCLLPHVPLHVLFYDFLWLYVLAL